MRWTAPFRTLALLFALPILGCTPDANRGSAASGETAEDLPPPRRELWHVMGTYAAVSVPEAEEKSLAEWARKTRATFEDLNSRLSTYLPESEISRLNDASGKRPVTISDTTAEVLRLSARYSEATERTFEPTLAPLIRLWGFSGGRAPQRLLERTTVEEALRSVGMVHLKVEEGKASLELPGMAIDLGGIAKGFAVDVAYEELLEAGARNVLVDLGGNMRGVGHARGDRPWVVGVRNPFEGEELLGTLRVTDGLAVATSGNYEQFVFIEGKRYTHIIDPRTGYPSSGMAGVTVLSQTATEADALSTALFVLGPEEGRRILKNFPGSHAVFVPDGQPLEIILTPGMEGRFDPGVSVAGSVRVLRD